MIGEQMKLDRNLGDLGKYALILVRKLPALGNPADDPFGRARAGSIWAAIRLVDREGLIDWGPPGSDSEFFVMRLKDRHSHRGLNSYADDALATGDKEYSQQVFEM